MGLSDCRVAPLAAVSDLGRARLAVRCRNARQSLPSIVLPSVSTCGNAFV